MVTTAVTALTIGAAAAQSTGKPPAPAGPQAASPSAPAPKSSEMTKPAPSDKSAKFIGSQQSDQYLASNFKGTDVIGADGKKIGDVNDVLFDKDGKILAYVVSVGGFLGLGSKDIALEPSAFQVVAGDKSKNEPDKLRLSMTQDQLKQAANFEPYKAPSSTTGMGSTSPARPSPGGMAR
jgi:sporulation protein YlmC with PRC-barrel domain